MNKLLLIIILIIILGIIGNNDYQDQVAEQDFYCQMVKDKAWPPYKGEGACP